MNRLKLAIKILKQRSELDFAYIYGDKIGESLFFQQEYQKKKFKSRFYSLVAVIYGMCKSVFLKKKKIENESIDLLFYAATLNQYSSILGVYDQSIKQSEGINAKLASYNRSQLRNKRVDVFFGNTVFDIIQGMLLLFLRFPTLNREVNNNKWKEMQKSLGYSSYFSIYFYLILFQRILLQTRPKLIVMANDHNVDTRCLLFIAKEFGIKTAYIQHAHVGPLFPPLEFDFAFLDGEIAYNIYKQIGSVNSQVVLSGIQKDLPNNPQLAAVKKKNLGMALNLIDSWEKVRVFLDKLIDGVKVDIRLHPAMNERDVPEYVGKHKRVEGIHSAKNIPLGVFFARIGELVAGSTSLHLEASLCRITCFYYNFGISTSETEDVYGFVKQGIIFLWKEQMFVQDKKIQNVFDCPEWINKLQRYSETFGTEYEGRENEYVACNLMNIIDGKTLLELK